MIYLFRTPFVTSKGRKIKPGEAVFVDDIDATDEIATEVKKRLDQPEEDKPKRKAQAKPKTQTN